MTKIIFREVEYTDYTSLYDDDGIKEISGKNNALYIIAGRDYMPVNEAEYQEIFNTAENIANDFYDLINGSGYYFKSFKEICNYYGIKYSPWIVNKLKKFAEKYTGDYDNIAEYLTITTGEKWNTYTATGYCQGDFATGIYCENHYTDEALELYVGAAAGTVREFCRIENGEKCYGFFVPDEITWNTDKLKEYLAGIYGDEIKNISVELIDGYTTTVNYMEV